MDNQQALKKARKLWGNKAYVRNSNHGISSTEKRQDASDKLRQINEEMAEIDAMVKRRLSELDWYMDAMKRASELRKEREAARGDALYQRFTVGVANNLFVTVYGSGDTFEEAFAEAQNKHFGKG